MTADRSEERRLLFVCTGNTCRTPLAEAAARREAARREIAVEVRSVGTFAARGQPAAGGALRTARREGLDLSGHRSEPVTEEALQWAEAIYGMTPAHVRVVNRLAGREVAALLTETLPPEHPSRGAPVSDPVGGPDAGYQEAFVLIEECIRHLFDELEERSRMGPTEGGTR